MGYTHYWYRKERLAISKFKAFRQDVLALYLELPDGLAIRGWDGTGAAEFTQESVRFNGNTATGESCETFHFPRILETQWHQKHPKYKSLYFQFCKTRREPYDLLVMATLICAKHHFGKAVLVSSDGGYEDWQPAIDFVNTSKDWSVVFEDIVTRDED